MKTVNLVQGTLEWHAFRNEKFTASEASAMLGLSIYKTREDLLKEKVTGIRKPVSDQQQRLFDEGHRTEALQRPLIEAMIEDDFFPVTGVSDEWDRMSASFDGVTMGDDVIFEHKLFSQKLIDAICALAEDDDLPDTHWPQIEHQLYVLGNPDARVIFVTSDGTEQNRFIREYRSRPERQAQLIAGWKQFEIDLNNYQVKEEVKKVKANETFSLPVVTFSIDKTSLAISSNLDFFKTSAAALVEESKKPLTTDQDFANAEQLVKTFTAAESKLAEISVSVLGEVESINQFVKDIDQIRELIRQARLNTDKQVKTRKDEIKKELILAARKQFEKHVATLQASNPTIPIPMSGFNAEPATKNKRTVKSLQDSVNQYVADEIIKVNALAETLKSNKLLIESLSVGYEFLFADLIYLLNKPADDLKLLVESRILMHKNEQERKEREQEALRLQEEQRQQKLQELSDKLPAEPSTPISSMPVEQTTSLLNTDNRARVDSLIGGMSNSSSNAIYTATIAGDMQAAERMTSISVKRLSELLEKERCYDALVAFGVDNWDGYDEAMENVRD